MISLTGFLSKLAKSVTVYAGPDIKHRHSLVQKKKKKDNFFNCGVKNKIP